MAWLNDRLLIGAVALSLLLALLWRLYPVAAGMPALAELFVTEDGYLMLTVARNLALGLGLSVSEGTIPTNGVQPLATLLYALPFRATGGERVEALVWLHLMWAGIAVAAMLAVRSFAARLLAPEAGAVWPWLAAALWFCGPLLVGHSMNGLETGLYTLAVLLACLQFGRVIARGAGAGTGDLALMGALLGLAFLARNDAVFLVLAMAVVWVAHALAVQRLSPGAVLRRLPVPALVCAAVAAPWLVHNFLLTGSIVPVSGTAQSLGSQAGGNLPLLPATLFEHFLPMLPIPTSLERVPAVMAVAATVSAVLLAGFFWRMWQRGGPMLAVALVYGLFGAGLAVYYGAFFGAPHFMPRYLAPLAPLLIVATLQVALDVARALRARRALVAAGVLSLALSLGLTLRPVLQQEPDPFSHFQVVGWVQQNVPDETWVGAVQTGTLGFWHDRTINLDGKVNPAALEARRQTGHVLDYVADSPIDYLADWVGIADWVNREGFGAHFEVVVEDETLNFGVLRRRAAP